MTTTWHLSEAYQGKDIATLCQSFEQAFALHGEVITKAPTSYLTVVKYQGKQYYVKKYWRSKRWYKEFAFVKSKAKREWTNLNFFSRLNIPTVPIVACGEQTKGGFFKAGIIISEEIPNVVNLTDIAKDYPEKLKEKKWLDAAIEQVADYTRRLHANHFFHVDLKWRNILVSKDDLPKIYFIDCPSGRKVPPPFLWRCIIKDLACLDKRAKYNLSAKERVQFYKAYRGIKKLTRTDKWVIRQVIKFFDGRE